MRAEAEEARFGPLLAATPKGDIRHLIPRSNAVEQMGEGASPAMLLFPRFGFEPATRPVARSECFMRLTQASTNSVALGEAGFAALPRFIDTVPAHALDYASAADAIDLVDALLSPADWAQRSWSRPYP